MSTYLCIFRAVGRHRSVIFICFVLILGNAEALGQEPYRTLRASQGLIIRDLGYWMCWSYLFDLRIDLFTLLVSGYILRVE